MRRSGEGLLVLLACAALYLPGLARIPFYTRGEPREGLVAREMLRSGEWLVPARPGGELARKPPLYYWAAASALRQLPAEPELALRLPCAILATAAVLGTWATAAAVFGPPAALPSALILASAFEWTRAATSARVDMALGAALTVVLAAWMLALTGRPRWRWLAVAGAALGTLAKGPVALVLPALAATTVILIARSREPLRRLRPLAGLVGGALLAGAWYAVALSRNGAAFAGVVGGENWRRFVAASDHVHGAGYLVPLGLVGLLPWTPLLPLAVGPPTRAPRTSAAALAAAWAVSGFVFFSLAAGKRSVYLLPLYPAAALLVGAGAAAGDGGGRIGTAARLGAALYAPGALVLAGAAALLAAGVDPTTPLRPLLAPADAIGATALVAGAHAAGGPLALLGAGTAVAAVIVHRARRRAAWRTLVIAVAATAIAWTAFFDARLHPVIARSRSLQSFAADVDRLVPPGAPLYVHMPADPGLRFYVARPLRPWPPQDHAEAHALLWDDQRTGLRDADERPLTPLAESEAVQPHHGHLALLRLPAGFRTGSRSR